MNSLKCPKYDRVLPATGSGGDAESEWSTLDGVVILGLLSELRLGMAKHGHLTSRWVIPPVLILVGLVVGRIFELRRIRRSRNASDRAGEP